MKKLYQRYLKWKYRNLFKKRVNQYASGYNDGFVAGQKSKERYPFL